MNGPQEIRNINIARSRQALDELKDNAVKAKQQGNDVLAASFQKRYEGLATELGVQH